MISISALNAPRLYEACRWQIKIHGVREESRAGPVLAMPEPTELNCSVPTERVVFDPVRNANPFFHLMETVWMFAGEWDVDWLEQFNRRYRTYAEPSGAVRGAYGRRWRKHFAIDQIQRVVDMLRQDPTTRRAVIGMWDPSWDADPGYADYPCNTHIYFRTVRSLLDMTVCNRSNDMIWGALGANIVHMTYLHELIARASGLNIGCYRVYTNNLHVYENLPNLRQMLDEPERHDLYGGDNPAIRYPVIAHEGAIRSFLKECEKFVGGDFNQVTEPWLREVCMPMFHAYQRHKNGDLEGAIKCLHDMPKQLDWRIAGEQWLSRKTSSSSI